MIDDEKKIDENDESANNGADDEIDFGDDDFSDSDIDDEIDMDDDVNFDDFGSSSSSDGGTLGDLWRNNPLVKIGVILAVAAVIFGIIIAFSGGEEDSQPSVIRGGGSDITSTPGDEGATRDFIEAVQETNETNAEEALMSGGSALPVPIESPVQTLEPAQTQEPQEDPLDRWRRLQEQRLEEEVAIEQQQRFQAPTGPPDNSAAQAVQAMAEAMSQQMQAILQNKTEAQISYKTINTDAYLDALAAEEAAEEAAALEQQQLQGQQAQGVNQEEQQTILLPAGEILYSQLINEANSDTPGPVVAQIVSGPLKGSRVLGDFEVQKELLTLNFHTAVIDGESISIDAVALDPNTTIPGMATEVNHRYFQRIVLPAAAAFVEGTASAIANSGLTTVTVSGDTVTESEEDASQDQEISAGVEEMGREVGDVLDEIANDAEILVRIAAGTPMGLLFLQPVIKENKAGGQSNLDVLPQ